MASISSAPCHECACSSTMSRTVNLHVRAVKVTGLPTDEALVPQGGDEEYTFKVVMDSGKLLALKARLVRGHPAAQLHSAACSDSWLPAPHRRGAAHSDPWRRPTCSATMSTQMRPTPTFSP